MDMMVIDVNDLMADKIANPAAIVQKVEVPMIRMEALQQTASALGAQAGLKRRAAQLNVSLEEKALQLDRIFDFNAMMVYQNVMAPVLTEGRATFQQNSEEEIRISDRMFKIERSARFVPHPPTWRDYLQQNTTVKIETPHASLLPKNEGEKAVWNDWVKKGWVEGEEQANALFEKGVARLRRDYAGMIQYKILLKQGLVTAPIVAQTNLGVTGGGTQMSLKDQVYRISVPTNLIADTQSWKQYPIE
jgi:defect-in-organelle-trafficking protein DotC